jgi:2-methylisocitrate lyase-like PEP mutase family enzyme
MSAFPVKMTSPTSTRLQFRELVAAPEILVAPGPFDASSAILMAKMGFKAFWAGGYVGSATSVGAGDLALTSMTEQLRFCNSLVEATGLPIIADCDDGYGGVLQVARTTQLFERAGVAAIVIEDQAAPKHCAFYDEFPLRLITKQDMVGKLQAALDSRLDETTMIWARSDALAAGLGIAETLDRARTYAETGADAIFVPSTKLQDLKEYASQWDRPEPLVISATAFVDLNIQQAKDMGFSVLFNAFTPILAALRAVEDVMGEYLRTGTLASTQDRIKTFHDFEELLDTHEYAEFEKRYHGGGQQPEAALAGSNSEQH